MACCGECNFYHKEKRICVIEEKFYFESFPACEKYKEDIINKELLNVISTEKQEN